jgi:hypothetical protein
MDLYNDINIDGELWFRDANDNVYPASQALSSIYYKYKNIDSDFYYELQNNIIKKFDNFYDTLFIQTSSGYVFEKYSYQNSKIVPYNQLDNHFIYQTNLNIDYWLNEKEKTIYWVEFKDLPYDPGYANTAVIKFAFDFKKFDLRTGIYNLIFSETIKLYSTDTQNLTQSNGVKETPKLTYNSDTNVFNISFIIRNDFNVFGLISVNFNQSEVLEVNTFVPYANILTSNITPTPSPTPTVTQTPTQTPTPSVTVTPNTSPSSTPTPTPTVTPTQTTISINVKSVYVSFD